MSKRLVASFTLMAAICFPAFASDPIILFRVKQNGHVFIDCIGVDYIGMASVKARLEELKRWNARQRVVEFIVEDGAPAALVSKYHMLVVSEGFRFGKSSGGPCN